MASKDDSPGASSTASTLNAKAAETKVPLLKMDGIVVSQGRTIHYGMDRFYMPKVYGPGTAPPFQDTPEDAEQVLALLESGVLVDTTGGATTGVAPGQKAIPKAGSDKEKE